MTTHNKIPASYYLDKPDILQGVLDGMEGEYQHAVTSLTTDLSLARARIAELEAALREIGASSVITRRIREIIRAVLKDTP